MYHTDPTRTEVGRKRGREAGRDRRGRENPNPRRIGCRERSKGREEEGEREAYRPSTTIEGIGIDQGDQYQSRVPMEPPVLGTTRASKLRSWWNGRE